MSVTVFDDRICKANREHRCDLCGDNVVVGEKYIRRVISDSNDGFNNMKLHQACSGIAEKIGYDWENHDALEFRNNYL